MKGSPRKIGMLSAALLLAVALSGCANQSQPRAQQNPANPQAQGNANNDNITEGTGNVQQDADRSNTGQNKSKPREAQNIANSLTGKYNIQSAYVLVTDSTAYVACDVNAQSGAQMTEAVKNSISSQVRSVDPSIQRVYVSTDADTVQHFRDFGSQLRSGQPVQGLTSQFTDMVRRVWPEAK